MENKQTKKVEEKKDNNPDKTTQPKMRQIIIETNGNDVNLIKAEVSGMIELVGVLQILIDSINKHKLEPNNGK